MDTIAISDFRNNIASFVTQVNRELNRLIITVSGQPKAVVISPEELESLEETAEVLSISGIKETLKKSQKQAAAGKTISLNKLEKKYL